MCLALVLRFMHLEEKSKGSSASRLKSIDWIGCVLFSSSLVLFLIAISWVSYDTVYQSIHNLLIVRQGGVIYPWRSLGTLLPLVLGIVGFISWVIYSYKYCKSPMIPLVVLNDRTAAISYFGTVIQGLAVSLFHNTILESF
jgi:hypothetical protein